MLAASPLKTRAQSVQAGVSGGLAVPTGDYGKTRIPGPLVRGTLTFGGQERRVRPRADIEVAWLLDQADDATVGFGSSRQGTLRAVSALASIVMGPAGAGFAPYVIAGAGGQRLRVAGSRNPYGTVGGVRGGAGLRFRARRAVVHAEVTLHWALTDFGTGRDFGMATYVPAVIGISF